MKRAIPSLYAEYGRHIDTERAIPNYIDLLKPSERRCLLAVNELTANKLVKSANVVGVTITKFHPHGDSVAFDTLVNMVDRGWVLKKGNFGRKGKENSPPAAYRYCITEDSLIPTQYGIKPIIELELINQSPILVSNYNSNVTATKWFDIGKDKIYKLKTENGYELKGNSDHRIVIMNENLLLKWKKLKDITDNDIIVMKSIYKTPIKKDKSQFNLNFYGVLGGLISKAIKNDFKIILNSDDNKFYNYIKNNLKHINADNVYETIINLKNKKKNYILNLYDEFWQNQFSEYLMEEDDSENQNIPQIIWNGNINEQKEFLKLLFSGSCSINNQKTTNLSISYFSNSKKILKDLHQMLLICFGIVSFIKYKHKKLVIVGYHDCKQFYDKIGLLGKKQNILKQYLKLFINSYNIRGVSSQLPNINKYLMNKYKSKEFKTYFLNNKDALKQYWNNINSKIDVEDQIKLENLMFSDYIFQKVNSIKLLSKKENVYCIRVDSSDHSFLSNGFISHNSEVKQKKDFMEYAFHLEKFIQHEDPDKLGYPQPMYLSTPIPLGITCSENKHGQATIKGIAFHTCEIPKYKYSDLVSRLSYLFQKELDDNIPEVIIRPYVYNHKVVEESPDEFKKILEKGEGVVLIYPKMFVDKEGIHVLGYPPTGCKKWISYCEENKIDVIDCNTQKTSIVKKKKIKVNEINNDNHNIDFELIFNKKGKITQEFIDEIFNLTTSKLNFKCNVVKDQTVKLFSIDDILINNYTIWVKHYTELYTSKQNAIEDKIWESEIIAIVRKIIDENNIKLNNVEDILNIFNTKYSISNPTINDENIKDVCNKYNIKSLIEHNINKNSLLTQLQDIKNYLSNININAYNQMIYYTDLFNF